MKQIEPWKQPPVCAAGRDSSLEALRIVSMVLILAHHYVMHGGVDLTTQTFTGTKLLLQMTALGGKVGVNCFVLVTGYFLVRSGFKMKKFGKLMLQILFYSVGIFVVFTVMGWGKPTLDMVVKAFFPVTFGAYWFVTVYVVLYLFSGFLNHFLCGISQRVHGTFLLVSLLLWCVVPTFLMTGPALSSLGWFVVLYACAAYVRRYPSQFEGRARRGFLLAGAAYGVMASSVVVLDLLGTKFPYAAKQALYFMPENRLPALLCAFGLFWGFRNLRLGERKAINVLASATFGVYLLHDNEMLRTFLWGNWLQNAKIAATAWLPLHIVGSVAGVYLVATIIELARQYCFERPLFFWLRRYDAFFTSVTNCVRGKLDKLFVHKQSGDE